MTSLTEKQKPRFVGSLLGCAFGDVLGAPVEMRSHRKILHDYPDLLRDFQPSERGYGCYTDDTEMTLALARSILRTGTVEAADCSCAYAEAFTPQRGYGRSAVQVLTALQRGADWQKTGSMLFPEGSFGNGAAMRIAPVGLVYGHLDAQQLTAKVKAAVSMTHIHREAIETAVLQARAIGLLRQATQPPDAQEFIAGLIDYLPASILHGSLQLLAELLRQRGTAEKVLAQFGCGVRSRDSWPPALWAALRYSEDPEEAIIQAVNLGGDTDTIGAMTGVLVGALHGEGWFPPRWYDQLENTSNGRDELVTVAEQLVDIPAI